MRALSSPASRNISVYENRKMWLIASIPPREEGRLANRRRREAGCDGREGCETIAVRRGRSSRVVLAPRRWRQARGRFHGRRWLSSPAHRGEYGAAVKTIAQGMPVVRLPCGFLRAQSAHFFARKARGCGLHPAFPAPSSVSEGQVI